MGAVKRAAENLEKMLEGRPFRVDYQKDRAGPECSPYRYVRDKAGAIVARCIKDWEAEAICFALNTCEGGP